MRHKSQNARFGRQPNQRKALIRGLVYSLVEHGRITTTLAKCKELRRHVEKAITMGKKQTLHSRRLLMSRYPYEPAVDRIVDKWAPHFKTRPGGYTRILKIGKRLGDSAELALIELLDHAEVVVKVTVPSKAPAKRKNAAPAKPAKNKGPKAQSAKTA